MRLEIVLLVLGMTLVTYIPRALPAVFLDKIRLSPRLERFLNLIPWLRLSSPVSSQLTRLSHSSVYWAE